MSGIESLQATARVASVSRLRGSHPVLVVEDSDEDFDTVLTAARLAGIQHEIRRALTGDDCLSLLRGTSGHARAQIALVLLDLLRSRCYVNNQGLSILRLPGKHLRSIWLINCGWPVLSADPLFLRERLVRVRGWDAQYSAR